MKKNKGFTLVELICVVAIIAVIALIAVPAVAANIKESQEKLYSNQIVAIEEALANWAIRNRSELPKEDGDFIIVTLQQLKNEGLIEQNLQNPKKSGKDKAFKDDELELRIVKYHNNFMYNVITK